VGFRARVKTLESNGILLAKIGILLFLERNYLDRIFPNTHCAKGSGCVEKWIYEVLLAVLVLIICCGARRAKLLMKPIFFCQAKKIFLCFMTTRMLAKGQKGRNLGQEGSEVLLENCESVFIYIPKRHACNSECLKVYDGMPSLMRLLMKNAK
jgi:hypothetical protein